MRTSRLWAILAPAVLLLSLQLASPTSAHADSYQLVGLGIDNVAFYGLSTSGQAVFNSYTCGLAQGPCYGSYDTGYSSAPPALTWDNGSACASPLPAGTSVLSSICNNGRETFYGYESGDYGIEGLYSFLGTNTPQLISSGYFAGGLHMNSLGNIVYDDGAYDEWYEADDLTPPATPAPEPTTLLLLGTGILAPIYLRRRRRTPALIP